MNDVIGAVLLQLAVLCAIDCVPVRRSAEIALPPKRIVQLGYSMAPLSERGWYVVRRTPTVLALGKQSGEGDDTVTILAESYEITPAFLTAPPQDSAGAGADRFKLVKAERTADERPTCVRHYVLTEDQAPARRSGGAGPMMLEAIFLRCVHPDDEAVGISLAYSHRHEPGQRDASFDIKAMEVLKSMQFAAPGRLAKGEQRVH
jgi:hypothetical protein